MFTKKFNFFQSPLGRIAINMFPTEGPWGGSSTFVSQLTAFLRWRGFEPVFSLKKPVEIILLIDPREDLQKKSFGMNEIRKFKEKYPHCKIIHRINECDKRKGTNFMDNLLADANKLSDYTVFISEWLKNYHAESWFDIRKPHRVIYNGADPRIFHPIGATPYRGEGPFRLVTHHWSDNPLKGFPIYEELDDWIYNHPEEEIEFWIIGRWPRNIRWRAAKTFPATFGRDLADKLRCCHAYFTASLWEPCGMHHIEGAQCGLPLIYHEDGGGINEAGRLYGIGFREDMAEAVLRMKKEYPEYRARLLKRMPSGDRMCLEYLEIIQELLS